jgi:Putative quorum-sensing-regulated virulence factor
MPFGKYKGEDLEDVDTSYLRWLRDKTDLDGWLANAVRKELLSRDDEPPGYSHQETRRAEPPPQRSDLLAIVSRWHRQLSRQFHPDAGGDERGMTAVNVGRDLLLELLREEGLSN